MLSLPNSNLFIARPDRDFLGEYFELHRRDAVAMERLTQSPYVMDIYGYCGQSAVTELAFLEKGINDLYRLSTGLRGIDNPYVTKSKLQIAAMTALGLAHIHGAGRVDSVNGIEKNTSRERQERHNTIVHYDINPRNVIITSSGRPKLNDFNVAEFLTWNPKTKTPCGFQSRLHEPWWRAPEEMILYENTTANGITEIYPELKLTEKVDIYSLGNTLYVLLTGTEPRGKENKHQRHKRVSNEVARGYLPSFGDYEASSNPSTVAIREAIAACWEKDPRKRPTAEAIAQGLFAALDRMEVDVSQVRQNKTL